jgi:hypothetical protein
MPVPKTICSKIIGGKGCWNLAESSGKSSKSLHT